MGQVSHSAMWSEKQKGQQAVREELMLLVGEK